jgi:arylformamidase
MTDDRSPAGPRRYAGPRIDLTMPLDAAMPAFPGDPEISVERVRTIARGDPYNLSVLRLGSHAGTHIDPPLHFIPGATSVDRLDLDLLNGPALVLEIPPSQHAVGPPELRSVPVGTERLLLRTSNSARWERGSGFFPEYVAVTLAGAQKLRTLGVRFVGIDALSIESDPSERFPVHRDLLGHGVPILEGLLLGSAPEGAYWLDCLPLRLKNGDGGPARAVLRALEPGGA